MSVKQIYILIMFSLFIMADLVVSAIPSGMSAGSSINNYVNEKKRDKVDRELLSPGYNKPSRDEKEITGLPYGKSSVFIRSVILQDPPGGDDLSGIPGLKGILDAHIGEYLTLEDMKKIALNISGVLSTDKVLAYIPRQSFSENILYINLREAAD